MRKKAIICAAVLMIIVLVSCGPPAVTAQPAPQYSVEIKRVAQISGWGMVTVNDTLTIRNKSSAALADVPVGLPRNVTTGLRYLAAKDNQNKVLTIDCDLEPTAETYWFKVNLAKPISYNETYVFTVTYVFTSLLVPYGGGFQYRFVTSPILRVKATSENMTIVAGPQSKLSIPAGLNLNETSVGGYVHLRGYFAAIEPYSTRPIVLNMTSAAQFIVRVPHANREINFDPDGNMRVTDAYDFENLAVSISTIQLTLPQNATNVMAYDEIGPLWDSPRQGPDISVGPRYSGGIEANRTFTFTLKYEIAPRAYVTQVDWWGSYKYKFDLLSNVKYWVVDKLDTTIIVPYGLNVRSASPSLTSTSDSLFYRKLQYQARDVTPYADLALNLEYNYPAFWASSPVLFWAAIIELVLVASVLVARLRKPSAPKIPVPTEKLKEFVQLYDGRTVLRFELERMAQDLARGALNKHEYRRRRKAVEFRIGELDRALQPLEQDLKAFDPRYNELILRMERAEADIDANRLGEEHFRSQYRAGKISKESYETALADLNRRIDKSREIIGTSLVTLREEAR